MHQINIVMRPPDQSGLARLSFYIFSNYTKIWVPTGIKVSVGSWDKKKQKIKTSQLDHSKLNNLLNTRKANLSATLERLINDDQPITRETVKRYLKPVKTTSGVTEETGDSDKSLLGYFDLYLKRYKSTKSKGYLRNFKQTKAHLEGFMPSISFEDLTTDNLTDFIDYLLDDAELLNPTVNKQLSHLREVIKLARIDGINVPQDILLVKRLKAIGKPFWLTQEELKRIEDLQVLPEHEPYRDEFLYRCYTGLRHSDSFQFKPEHLIKSGKDHYLDFNTIKTRLDQNILLSSSAVGILKKYKFEMPRLYQHDCNEFIKTIARAARITHMVEKVRLRGSERIVSMLPAWKMVTTHTARRTFARMWIDRGGDIAKLSLYLGHSSIKQTSEYIGYQTKEVNDELRRIMG